MGRCEFGAHEVEGGFQPFISFNDGDTKITFWSDSIVPDAEQARGLMLKIFDIVSVVKKKNLNFDCPPPPGGSYEAN